MPTQVSLAAAPYTSPDGGSLLHEYQVPASINADGNIDAGEYALFVIPPAYELSDVNCDGVVNAFDIDPVVLALTDPGAYASTYPECDIDLADINADGLVNAFDIDPFVVLLTGG